MNDRPDRLVHGRPTRPDDGVPGEDTQPHIPPQRGDTVPPRPEEPHSGPGDVPDRDTPPTGADRAGTGRPVPEDAGPGDRPQSPDPVHADQDPSALEHADLDDRPEPSGADPAPRRTPRASLFDRDPEDVRRRWQEVQVGFVDDPRDAVERAHSLLDELVTSIRTALETRATDLQALWKEDGDNDTERLRTALRDYRSTLEELLGLPITSTGKR
ncbi:hypothetical protein HS041_18245 [Planomonospora sp. ID67723]|uniref:hypothetical protein n=1 Tax=Planomonospora sp. ID67723 TaxID=2738134 RepID=UPI0018C36853|nr:hypothetical protein [Planomonospora sp. ID67723]MBG0829709.1 hypothetical protein [Planomonospora sp. ID67723]